MKLTLDPSDLKPEFQVGEGDSADQAIPTTEVVFDKLTEKAQKAVQLVGKATFQSWDRKTHNRVYPPK